MCVRTEQDLVRVALQRGQPLAWCQGLANVAWARTVQTRTVFVWEHKEGFLTPLNPSPVFSAMKLIRPSCGCLFCQRPELDAVSLWLLTGFARKDTERRFFVFIALCLCSISAQFVSSQNFFLVNSCSRQIYCIANIKLIV